MSDRTKALEPDKDMADRLRELESENTSLREGRDKLERDIRDLVYERADLLIRRDKALNLVASYERTWRPVGQTKTFIADLRNTLTGGAS